jgi:enamine deaminase RidA (YjgF/YER057c/UK114 family)
MIGAMPSPHDRLAALGLELPPAPAALAAYLPTTLAPLGGGRALLSVSGQVWAADGRPVQRGRVPDQVSAAEAEENARQCALRVLAQLEAAVGLERVEQVLQVTVYVRSADSFEAQPQVGNAASELLVAVLGEAGRHARAAVGVNALPLGVPVEVSALALVRPPTRG